VAAEQMRETNNVQRFVSMPEGANKFRKLMRNISGIFGGSYELSILFANQAKNGVYAVPAVGRGVVAKIRHDSNQIDADRGWFSEPLMNATTIERSIE
jgi:hypothetical protein